MGKKAKPPAAGKGSNAAKPGRRDQSAPPRGKGAKPRTPPLPAPAATDRGGGAVLDRLHGVILERRTADPSVSHSARLLQRGTAKAAQKLGEEAVECVIEAAAGRAEALVAESADLLYHLLVVWVAVGITPAEVWAELERREGVSGIAEKASRPAALGTTKIP